MCLKIQVIACLSNTPQVHHYRHENGKLASANAVFFENIQSDCMDHVLRQRIPNYVNVDSKIKLWRIVATTKWREDILNQCRSICEECKKYTIDV